MCAGNLWQIRSCSLWQSVVKRFLIWFKRSYYVSERRLDHHTALRFR
jgi:hypothetical protein